jgi:hypothetical protein
VPQISILDLGRIDPTRSHIYAPRLMMNLCLGYLKLCEADDTLKPLLTAWVCEPKREGAPSFRQVIELWLAGDSPFENESARMLVKFMSRLRIPNDVVLEWVTQKSAASVYHKCGDLLLQYIAEAWSEPQAPEPDRMEGVEHGTRPLSQLAVEGQIVQAGSSKPRVDVAEQRGEPEPHYSCLGEFLVAKIPSHQAQLYALFIPLAEKLSATPRAAQNMSILVEHLPAYCAREIKHEFKDVAINQIKLLGFVAVKASA